MSTGVITARDVQIACLKWLNARTLRLDVKFHELVDTQLLKKKMSDDNAKLAVRHSEAWKQYVLQDKNEHQEIEELYALAKRAMTIHLLARHAKILSHYLAPYDK